MLISHPAGMKGSQATPDGARFRQSTQFSNLIRYTPSETYSAGFRVIGKLIGKTSRTGELKLASRGLLV
jgi:hypothetical protein